MFEYEQVSLFRTGANLRDNNTSTRMIAKLACFALVQILGTTTRIIVAPIMAISFALVQILGTTTHLSGSINL